MYLSKMLVFFPLWKFLKSKLTPLWKTYSLFALSLEEAKVAHYSQDFLSMMLPYIQTMKQTGHIPSQRWQHCLDSCWDSSCYFSEQYSLPGYSYILNRFSFCNTGSVTHAKWSGTQDGWYLEVRQLRYKTNVHQTTEEWFWEEKKKNSPSGGCKLLKCI